MIGNLVDSFSASIGECGYGSDINASYGNAKDERTSNLKRRKTDGKRLSLSTNRVD